VPGAAYSADYADKVGTYERRWDEVSRAEAAAAAAEAAAVARLNPRHADWHQPLWQCWRSPLLSERLFSQPLAGISL